MIHPLAGTLFKGPSKDLGKRRIDISDIPLHVIGYNGVGCRLHQQGISFLAFPLRFFSNAPLLDLVL